MNLAQTVTLHLRKDLRLEWRSKDAANSMLFFALLVVVVFAFAFDPVLEDSRNITGGIAWVALVFATIVALNQSWTRELRNGVLDALRLAPAPPNGLFLGKVIANFLFVTIVEIPMSVMFVVFYNLHVLGSLPQLALVVVLGTWALVVNGTFFSALSIRTRNRELMLPLILLPISLPAILGMVVATENILRGDASPAFGIKLVAVYDIVFTTVSLLLFESVLGAE